MKSSKKDVSNQELLEFIKENVAMKEDLKGFATKVELKSLENNIIQKLDGVSKQLLDIQAENAANISAHMRFEHRDDVFAGKLGLNLNAVDAEG